MRPRKAALTAHSEGPPKEKISLSLELDRDLPLEAARKVGEVEEDVKVEVEMSAVRCERCRCRVRLARLDSLQACCDTEMRTERWGTRMSNARKKLIRS